jgi:drug/metabolite transporter (DMT)-like permease
VFAVLLALASSLAYGCADFLGGLAARRTDVLRTVAFAAPASLLVELVLWPLLGAGWSPAAFGWGAASGVASAASFGLLYATLALGPMSVLSPITALVSAVLPVAVGLAQGERLSAGAVTGVGLALVAVVLVSTAPRGTSARPSPVALALAVGAGTAIAVQLVCLHQAPVDSGLAPLIAGRAVSSVVVLAAVVLLRGRWGGDGPDGGNGRAGALAALAAGSLDSLANLAFLLAARRGDLAVVAVVTALYPAATVLLARTLLAERLRRGQLVGLAAGAVAVGLLALT